MISGNKILFLYVRIFVLGFLFCFALIPDVMGQEERSRAATDSPSDYSGVSDLEESDLTGFENINEEKTVNIAPAKKAEQPKQAGVEKGLKKDGMSTLSFNLFLYVVDKFKEDN